MNYFSGKGYEGVYIDVLRRIYFHHTYKGRVHGKTFVEVPGLTMEIKDPRDRLVFNAARDTNYEFAMKMFLWIVNGHDDYEYVGGVNPNAAKFIDTDVSTMEEAKRANFNTAYGPRIYRQLPSIIEELSNHMNSRRATINILNEDDKWILNANTKTEFPCAETVTFMIREIDGENRLICHVNMRSNNMVTTVVYDVFVFTMLQEYVFKAMKKVWPSLKMGPYIHHCTSAHIFVNDYELVDRILASKDSKEVAMRRHRVPIKQEVKSNSEEPKA